MTCSSARKVRILVVDDNRDTAESLGLLLTLSGYTVSLAFDGEQAVEFAINQRPEIVLLDIRLPRLSGYQVASRIRRELSPQSLIIAISGMTRDDTCKSATESGCDHFLVKPVDHEKLLELFSEHLNKTTALQDIPLVQASSAPRMAKLINPLGFHLRAATRFVQTTQRFQAAIRVTFGDREVDGRSILDLTTLAVPCGETISLKAEGPDAGVALDALTALVAQGFDEMEQGDNTEPPVPIG